MSVIKANHATPFIKDAIVLDLGDVGRQAERIRMAAEEKAAAIITDAERKAKQILADAAKGGFEEGKIAGLEAGLNEGRREGHAQALKEASEQLAQLQAAWSDVISQWDEQTRSMLTEARQLMLEFALKFAERLVHRVIEVDRSVVVDQLASALSLVLKPMSVTVRVNPSDLPIISEALPQLMAEFDHLEHIHLAEDPNVGSGGCVVTYGQGQIDATIEKQMQRIVDLILPPDSEAQAQPLSDEDSALNETSQAADTDQAGQEPVDD